MAVQPGVPEQVSAKRNIALTINGKSYEFAVEPQQTLTELLREELHLMRTKEGCGVGECGSCTVVMDKKAVPSCLVLAVDAAGSEIVTVEGMSRDSELQPMQEAFIDHQAAQCGYCTNGMIMAATAFLKVNATPTVEEIQKAMTPWLCRCGTHFRIVSAIQAAAKVMA